MKRFAIVLFTVAVLAAACSSAPAGTDESADQTTSSAAGQADTTTVPNSSDTGAGSTGSTEVTAPKPEGPVAPNFTLALASGNDFVLADAAKPVYMVFWAEW